MTPQRRTSREVKIVAAACAFLLLTLIGMTLFAARKDSLLTTPRQFAMSWWGVSLLANVIVCRMFMACWIVVMERGLRRAMSWVIAVMALGVPVMLLYLLIRARKVRDFEHLFRRHEAVKPSAAKYPLPAA